MNKSQVLLISLLSLPAITQRIEGADADKKLASNAWKDVGRKHRMKNRLTFSAEKVAQRKAKSSIEDTGSPFGLLSIFEEDESAQSAGELHDISLAASSSTAFLSSSCSASHSACASSSSSSAAAAIGSSASAAAPAVPEESPKAWLEYYAKGFALAAYGDADNRPNFPGLQTEWQQLTKYRKGQLVEKLAVAGRRGSTELNHETINGLHIQYATLLPNEPEDSVINPFNYGPLAWLVGR